MQHCGETQGPGVQNTRLEVQHNLLEMASRRACEIILRKL